MIKTLLLERGQIGNLISREGKLHAVRDGLFGQERKALSSRITGIITPFVCPLPALGLSE
jgi:hypothetical protein